MPNAYSMVTSMVSRLKQTHTVSRWAQLMAQYAWSGHSRVTACRPQCGTDATVSAQEEVPLGNLAGFQQEARGCGQDLLASPISGKNTTPFHRTAFSETSLASSAKTVRLQLLPRLFGLAYQNIPVDNQRTISCLVPLLFCFFNKLLKTSSMNCIQIRQRTDNCRDHRFLSQPEATALPVGDRKESFFFHVPGNAKSLFPAKVLL